MNDPLAALKKLTKVQISAASQQPNRMYKENLRKSEASSLYSALESQTDLEKRRKIDELKKAKEILSTEPIDAQIAQVVNNQIADPWSVILSEIKRQLDGSTDLRLMIADQSLIEEQEADHATVKFFKGILNEWRLRMFNLPDEELSLRKNELNLMWTTLFSLQPLFDGLNKRTLCREITVGTNDIVKALKKLDFNGAESAYYALSIGNSFWPIGVTQFSIQWKFSADLMDSDRVLHVFNNETSRNAIISIKKLMTKYHEFHKKKK